MARVWVMFDLSWSFGGTKTQDDVLGETDRCEVGQVPQDVHDAKGHSEMRRSGGVLTDTLGGMKNLVRSAALVALISVGVTACGSSNNSSASDTTVIDVQLVPAGKLIDVRTPEEVANGYIKGARHLNLLSGEFEAALAELDKDAEYSVYCRSGNRSAQAVQMMRNAGFKNVVDLGAVEEAAATLNLPIVTD